MDSTLNLLSLTGLLAGDLALLELTAAAPRAGDLALLELTTAAPLAGDLALLELTTAAPLAGGVYRFLASNSSLVCLTGGPGSGIFYYIL